MTFDLFGPLFTYLPCPMQFDLWRPIFWYIFWPTYLPFFNYVDQILSIIDHISDPGWHWWRSYYTVIRENLHTVDSSSIYHLPKTSRHVVNLRTTPYPKFKCHLWMYPNLTCGLVAKTGANPVSLWGQILFEVVFEYSDPPTILPNMYFQLSKIYRQFYKEIVFFEILKT